MFALVVAALVTASSAEARTEVPSGISAAASEPSEGLFGSGLAIEFPWLGPLGGTAPDSEAGWGYTFGGGISYEFTEAWRARVTVNKTRANTGKGYLAYVSGSSRSQMAAMQTWDAVLVDVGGAYVWEGLWEVPAAPFFGVDFVWGYGGYNYQYDTTANNVLASPPTQSALAPPLPHVALGWLFGAAVRGGVEVEILPWLHTVTELGVGWLPVGGVLVSNNREIRDVRTASQMLFLPYFAFGARVRL